MQRANRLFIPLPFLCFFRLGKTLQKRLAEGTERHSLPVHNPRIFSSFTLFPSLPLPLVSFLRFWCIQFVHLFLFLVSPSSRRWCMTGFHSLSCFIVTLPLPLLLSLCQEGLYVHSYKTWVNFPLVLFAGIFVIISQLA